MNFAALSLALIGFFSFVLSRHKGLELIINNSSVFLTMFSVFAAAVLVRLNRGLPSVDWKSVDEISLKDLLDEIEKVSKGYAVILFIIFGGLTSTVSVLFVGGQLSLGNIDISRTISGIVGAFLGLSISRMCHLIWIDVEIVRLQRRVVESAASETERKTQSEIAKEKLAEIESVTLPREK